MTLTVQQYRLQINAPIRIAGYVFDAVPVIQVTLNSPVGSARGEAAGVYYTSDTPESMIETINRVRLRVEEGISREDLRQLLPPGGARNAIDSALWELESLRAGLPVWELAAIAQPKPVLTTITLTAETPESMADTAIKTTMARALKLKLTGDVQTDIARIAAVRHARADVWLSVDANQGYDLATIDALLPQLVESRVELLEQPFARGREPDMQKVDFPVPTAADESCLDLAELDRVAPFFDVINIKLDKCGGLTEGLLMWARARALGKKVMVGNMGGSSLAMAPALILGQLCDVVDLDGPLFLANNPAPTMQYRDGKISDPGGIWGYDPAHMLFNSKDCAP